MKKKIEEAIEALAEKIDKDVKPGDALKYTQAMGNAAHARDVVERN
jgi:hypothetical protein